MGVACVFTDVKGELVNYSYNNNFAMLPLVFLSQQMQAVNKPAKPQ